MRQYTKEDTAFGAAIDGFLSSGDEGSTQDQVLILALGAASDFELAPPVRQFLPNSRLVGMNLTDLGDSPDPQRVFLSDFDITKLSVKVAAYWLNRAKTAGIKLFILDAVGTGVVCCGVIQAALTAGFSASEGTLFYYHALRSHIYDDTDLYALSTAHTPNMFYRLNDAELKTQGRVFKTARGAVRVHEVNRMNSESDYDRLCSLHPFFPVRHAVAAAPAPVSQQPEPEPDEFAPPSAEISLDWRQRLAARMPNLPRGLLDLSPSMHNLLKLRQAASQALQAYAADPSIRGVKHHHGVFGRRRANKFTSALEKLVAAMDTSQSDVKITMNNIQTLVSLMDTCVRETNITGHMPGRAPSSLNTYLMQALNQKFKLNVPLEFTSKSGRLPQATGATVMRALLAKLNVDLAPSQKIVLAGLDENAAESGQAVSMGSPGASGNQGSSG